MKVFVSTVLVIFASLFATRAHAQEVDVNLFYTSLQDKGDWFHADQYGYVFQPRRAVQDRNWRPYTDGHWAYSDQGWTWISNEDFGWATYHYGRWALIANTGWVWIPGNQWGPAWVSWRTNPRYEPSGGVTVATTTTDADSDYIGWAPLPPEAAFENSVGFTARVDEAYDIGPAYYCFVPTRSFTAPVLTSVIVEPARNAYFIARTVNVTNTAYVQQGGASVVFNAGPPVASISTVVEHPVQRVTIQRETTVGAGGGAHLANRLQGNTFQVVAPQIAAKGIYTGRGGATVRADSGVRPQMVKADLKQAHRATGWDQTGAPAQQVEAARTQIKHESTQAPKQASAPSAQETSAPNPAAPNAGRPAGGGTATAPPPANASQPPARPPGTGNPADRNAAKQPPAGPTPAPETAHTPPTPAPQANPQDRTGSAAPTPVPRRESEASPQNRPPGSATQPERESPRRESAKPESETRARSTAEQNRRDENRPPQSEANDERRHAQPPKSEESRNSKSESRREEQPPKQSSSRESAAESRREESKPTAPRSETTQREKAQPSTREEARESQPKGERARSEGESSRRSGEESRKSESPKKPQTTPVPER